MSLEKDIVDLQVRVKRLEDWKIKITVYISVAAFVVIPTINFLIYYLLKIVFGE